MPTEEEKIQLQCEEQVRSGILLDSGDERDGRILGANGRVWYLHEGVATWGQRAGRLAVARQQLWSE